MNTHIKCPSCDARIADKGNKKSIINVRCEQIESCSLQVKCYRCKKTVYIEIK